MDAGEVTDAPKIRLGISRCLLGQPCLRPPHVPHERGTELVIEFIEKHWCPTILSDDLLQIHGK